MTAKGTLVKCIEDMEIMNLDINFYNDILYTALINDEIFIIDRNHQSIKIDNSIFQKHFKII